MNVTLWSVILQYATILSVNILSVVVLNGTIIKATLHNVTLLSVALLSVAMVSVALQSVAPQSGALLSFTLLRVTKLSVFMFKVVVSNVLAPMEASSGLPVMKRKYLIKWWLRESCKARVCFKNSAYPNELDHFINVNIFFRRYEMVKLTKICSKKLFIILAF